MPSNLTHLNIQNLLIAVINAINDISDCDSSSLSGSSEKGKQNAVVLITAYFIFYRTVKIK